MPDSQEPVVAQWHLSHPGKSDAAPSSLATACAAHVVYQHVCIHNTKFCLICRLGSVVAKVCSESLAVAFLFVQSKLLANMSVTK